MEIRDLIGANVEHKVFGKGIKRVSGIKAFIIFAVASFNLAVMSGRKRSDQLMPDTVFHKAYLEECRFVRTTMGCKAFGEFQFIVCLDTLNRMRESLEEMFQELGRGIGTVFFKSLYKAPSGVFINRSILIKLFALLLR